MSKFSGIRAQQSPKPQAEAIEPPPEPLITPALEPANPPPMQKTKPLAKSKDPAYTQACAYLPKGLYGQVKSVVYRDGLEYSEYVEHLIRQDFHRRGLQEEF